MPNLYKYKTLNKIMMMTIFEPVMKNQKNGTEKVCKKTPDDY